MRINNNISAVITNKQLLGTESSLAAAMERLSSGYKINHASDNPSGLAIANKMRAQIRGLDQASRNSADGTSVLQTVDGALSEVTDMLQRMRELAVQAANGVNSQTEKDAVQLEISSLREEVDRIAATTEFNTKSLLDGSLDARVYPDKASQENVSRLSVSDAVAEGTYKLTVEQAATQARYDTGMTPTDLVGKNVNLTVNGYTVEIVSTMSEEAIKEAFRSGAEYADCAVEYADTGEISIVSNKYGAHAEVEISQFCKDEDVFADVPNFATAPEAKPWVDNGEDAKVTLDTTSSFGQQATFAMEGNRLIITDRGGFRMDMLLASGYERDDANGISGEITLDVTSIGILDLQVGANMGQSMPVRIPAMDVKSLYLDTINVSTVNGPLEAMDCLDEAITAVSRVRSQVGAFENRLEHTTASLDETEENITAAMSRIEDADMAEEMVEYTKYNVLEQAGTSALAQANELPELALQLLR